MTPPVTIYTAGHGTDSFDEFLERIGAHGVSVIVDVRSHPTSRHAPDFTKARLVEAAASAGIGYRWLGASLGGRPDDPRALDDSGLPDWEQIRGTAKFQAGLSELLALARTGTAVVMCAELDPRHCHRTLLIAPALVAAGCTVVDILGSGDPAPHQPPLA